MSSDEEAQDVPVHEGPEPRTWQSVPAIADLAADVRAVDEMLSTLTGDKPQGGMPLVYDEARAFLLVIARERRTALAMVLLDAYRVPLPEEEPAGQATEAVGGVRGDGNRPGDRDHL